MVYTDIIFKYWNFTCMSYNVPTFCCSYIWNYKKILDTSSNFIFLWYGFSFSLRKKNFEIGLKKDCATKACVAVSFPEKNFIQFNLLGEDYLSIRKAECIVKVYTHSFHCGKFTIFSKCTNFTFFLH